MGVPAEMGCKVGPCTLVDYNTIAAIVAPRGGQSWSNCISCHTVGYTCAGPHPCNPSQQQAWPVRVASHPTEVLEMYCVQTCRDYKFKPHRRGCSAALFPHFQVHQTSVSLIVGLLKDCRPVCAQHCGHSEVQVRQADSTSPSTLGLQCCPCLRCCAARSSPGSDPGRRS